MIIRNHSLLLKTFGLVTFLFLLQVQPGWSASKSRSQDAVRLSHEKLDKRCDELSMSAVGCHPNHKGETEGKGTSDYGNAVSNLRGEILKKEPNAPIKALALYTTPAPQVYTAAMDFIQKVEGCNQNVEYLERAPDVEKDPKKMQLSKLLAAVEALSSTQEALKDSMGTKSVKNGTKESLELQDTNLIGNLMHPKFQIKKADDSSLTVLRMGSQTIDIPKEKNENQRGAQVAPEFKTFIDGLPQGMQHVYVNLQMSVERGGIFGVFGSGFGDYEEERPRSEALHRFASDKEKLVMISLDKNSHFYQYFSPKGSVDEVVNTLADRFFPVHGDEDSNWSRTGINLTDLWRKDTGHCEARDGFVNNPDGCRALLKEMFIQNLKAIAGDIFKPGVSLDRDQSKALVDLAYQYVIDLASKKASSMNMSCKSGVDRAGGVNANVYLMSLLKDICSGTPSDKINEKIMNLRHVFFSDAVLYNGRPVNDDRLGRFQDSARVIIEGVLSKVNDSQPCLGSKDLLFSGKSLEPAFDPQRAAARKCLTKAAAVGCEERAADLNVVPQVQRLGGDLQRIRAFGIPGREERECRH
jgi:hypothetical protein